MKLSTTLLALALAAPTADAQHWVLQFNDVTARLQPTLWVQWGVPSGKFLRGVADDGRGKTLAAVECPGCTDEGELWYDGAPIATFPDPALDVDVTGDGLALVAAGDVWVVDLETGVSTALWSAGSNKDVISVAGLCGGDFYAVTDSFLTGLELVHVSGFVVTPQFTFGTQLRDVDCSWDGQDVIYASDDSVYFLGNPTPIYQANLGLGDSISGVAVDQAGSWAVAVAAGSQSFGEIVVNGVSEFLWVDQYPGDIDSVSFPSEQTLRIGDPPNPPALFATAVPPALGEVWEPVIDHTFFAPNHAFDFLAVSVKDPIEVPVPGVGTLLCQPPPPSQIFVAPAGQPFAVPMPPACDFGAFELCVQGGSFAGPGGIQLTNALDLEVGL